MGFEDRPSRHRRLAMILLREFEGLILKPDRGVEGLGPTLNDIWTGGKRLIICYGDKHTVNGKFDIILSQDECKKCDGISNNFTSLD